MGDKWVERWQLALDACERLGGDTRELVIAEPATEQEVLAVEAVLQMSLPPSFRQVLTQFSGHVEFWWRLPSELDLPHSLREIFGGECFWNLEQIVELETSRQEWIKTCFPDLNDEYDRVWHNKLAFQEVDNGDLLALDLALPSTPVVYLSHDDGEGHGYQLGANFADFLDRWTLLGCPGAEDWQMMPFISSPTSFLDPDCENATLWRKTFGLTLPQ